MRYDPIKRTYWTLRVQFGIDPIRTLRALARTPKFLRDYFSFRKQYGGPLKLRPCLHDWDAEGGSTESEYFWQDLRVAQLIFAAQPKRHADVGSRLDGFIAHVAAFREIEVFDVRPITASIPNVVFNRADFSTPDQKLGTYDSVSCLHALEHFGLGRYSDPIDPAAYERGLASLALLLEPGGTLYLSVPIGQASIEFNAHRIFDPHRLIEDTAKCGLLVESLTIIDGQGARPDVLSPARLRDLSSRPYGLALFTFQKTNNGNEQQR